MIFADGVLSGNKLALLGLYLLVCTVAGIVMAIFTFKIVYSIIKRRPYPKKYLAYIGGGVVVLILANLLIELV